MAAQISTVSPLSQCVGLRHWAERIPFLPATFRRSVKSNFVGYRFVELRLKLWNFAEIRKIRLFENVIFITHWNKGAYWSDKITPDTQALPAPKYSLRWLLIWQLMRAEIPQQRFGTLRRLGDWYLGGIQNQPQKSLIVFFVNGLNLKLARCPMT